MYGGSLRARLAGQGEGAGSWQLAAEGALERGADVVGPIKDIHWDFWTWIERPLEDVRSDLNVR